MSKKKISIDFNVLNQMGRQALLECCRITGVETTRLMKGGITCQLSCNQMQTKIRQQIGRGTFRDRCERLSFFLEDWEPSKLDPVIENEPNPEDVVRELIEDVRNALDRFSDVQILELITDWLQEPQGSCCFEKLDTIAEELGFRYEETDEKFFLLVAPSPLALSEIVSTISDATFYHTVIALAGMALPAEQFSYPPSMLDDGFNFLKELAKFLRAQSYESHCFL